MTSRPPVYGLVLAGGRSRRLGRDKALLQRDGESQLACMVATLERHVERVFVSTRPDQQADPRWLDNVNTPEDLAASAMEASS